MQSCENAARQENGAERFLTLRTAPMPRDTITDDYISAGWLLSEMDKAGGKRAYQYTGGRVVTAGIDAMSFTKPVHIGDLVSVYTEIARLGRTSVVVKIEAVALRRGSMIEEKVTEGYFAFVSIGQDRAPLAIANRAAANISIAPPQKIFAGPDAAPIERTEENLRVRAIPLPRDINHIGDIFGGWILEHMDLAGAKEAERYARDYAVTVRLESMSFYKPVLTGDEVSFYTKVVKVGRTSVAVKVETWVRRRKDRDFAEGKVTEGIFTYVCVDKNKKPVPVEIRRQGAA
jgi:acyl-CoA thioesterase YciA